MKPICLTALAGAAVLWAMGGTAARAATNEELERRIDVLSREVETLKQDAKTSRGSTAGEIQRTHVGGYAELHYLSTLKGDGENFDFHRYVLYFGHEFNDWIQFHSELEVEHSFALNGQGEVNLEQAYIDARPREALGIRAGIVLVPMGVVNQFHEPPAFHGVERPDVDVRIIPSTWRAAGAGFYGSLTENLKYQIYGINALQILTANDDADFAPQLGTDGIRDFRQNQFGSEKDNGVLDFAVAGRLDYAVDRFPLNVGFSYYGGSAGDKVLDTAGRPDIKGYAFDARYKQDRIDFVGEWAQFNVSATEKIKTAYGTDQAKQLEGWYTQGAYWLIQPGDRAGILADAGIAGFVRFEKYDTAKKMPSNATDPAQNSRDRRQWVCGFTFKPTQNLAVKVDYTKFKDADGTTIDNDKINGGIGWQF